jgi:hypothetical protein
MHPPQGKAKSLAVLALIGILGTLVYLHSSTPDQPKPVPKPVPLTLAAGTPVTLRLNSTVGSKVSISGQTFSGTLAHAIVIDGQTIVPADTEFSGKVIEAVPAGHLSSGASLRIALTSFMLNGTEHQIRTTSVARVSQGKGKRTVEMAGGGAAVGALVGALVDGGKGAAIGAALGGGAGTAGSAVTGSNRDIVMPAQSSVTFKLVAPLTVPSSQPPQTSRTWSRRPFDSRSLLVGSALFTRLRTRFAEQMPTQFESRTTPKTGRGQSRPQLGRLFRRGCWPPALRRQQPGSGNACSFRPASFLNWSFLKTFSIPLILHMIWDGPWTSACDLHRVALGIIGRFVMFGFVL